MGKVVVVLPAYNAARTLERTVKEIDRSVVDEIILVDDRSKDETVKLAKKIGIVVVHNHFIVLVLNRLQKLQHAISTTGM